MTTKKSEASGQTSAASCAPVILTCPFCGKTPKVRHEQPIPNEIDNPYFAVACENKKCPAAGPMTFGDTELEAVTNWNTRCEPRSSRYRLLSGKVFYPGYAKSKSAPSAKSAVEKSEAAS